MYKTILVPIDISSQALTQLVIPHVVTQAKQGGAHIHFLTVIPTFYYTSYFGLAYAPEALDQGQMKENALAELNGIVKVLDLPEDRIHLHVIAGSPKDQILTLADKINADLIIIGSHRPDITTYLLGSNATAVVSHATCPVLVIR